MMYANFLNKPLFWGVPTDQYAYIFTMPYAVEEAKNEPDTMTLC